MNEDEIQKLVSRVTNVYLIYMIIAMLAMLAIIFFIYWKLNVSQLTVSAGALLTFIGIFYSLTILPGEEEKNKLFLKLMSDIDKTITTHVDDKTKDIPIDELEIREPLADKYKKDITNEIKTIIRISHHIHLILPISVISLIFSIFFSLFSGAMMSTTEIQPIISYICFVIGGAGSLLIIFHWYNVHSFSMKVQNLYH